MGLQMLRKTSKSIGVLQQDFAAEEKFKEHQGEL
jgi:hypothetical protein